MSKTDSKSDLHSPVIRYLIDKQSHVTVLLALVGTLFVLSLNLTPLTTNDFWMQLEIGNTIRDTGSIPRTILFTHNESQHYPFVAHEWLSSCVYSV